MNCFLTKRLWTFTWRFLVLFNSRNTIWKSTKNNRTDINNPLRSELSLFFCCSAGPFELNNFSTAEITLFPRCYRAPKGHGICHWLITYGLAFCSRSWEWSCLHWNLFNCHRQLTVTQIHPILLAVSLWVI